MSVKKLHLPVHNVVLVEVLQCQQNFTAVEFGTTLAETLVILDVHHQISSTNVLHHKVDASVRLEARVQSSEEGVAIFVGHLEDSLLGPSTMIVEMWKHSQ